MTRSRGRQRRPPPRPDARAKPANRASGGWRTRLAAWLSALLGRRRKLRVVLDTNVWIDGLLDNDAAPAQILRLFYTGQLEAAISPGARREVELVLTNDDLRGRGAIPSAAKARLLAALREQAIVTHNRPLDQRVSEHEADDKFIAAALAARADYLVSADRHLLRVRRCRGVKIVTPERLLALWR
jgi:putative PIN family toxin of toxin-antitoxin system